MEEKLKEIFGLGVFWTVASFVASFLPPTAADWVGLIIGIVALAGMGSILLSVFLGGDGFDHLFAGFMLALAGFCVVRFGFGWHLDNPASSVAADWDKIREDAHNPGTYQPLVNINAMEGAFIVFLVMIKNLCILAVGMAIVAIPMVPVVWKLQKSSLEKAATPVPPDQSSTPDRPREAPEPLAKRLLNLLEANVPITANRRSA